jgi:threonyl-tRNA synthetase
LPVSEKHIDYAQEIYQKLFDANFRVELDKKDEKLGYKIRTAQMEKVPYMLILGDKEKENSNVSVRSRDKGDLGTMDFDDFINKLKSEL